MSIHHRNTVVNDFSGNEAGGATVSRFEEIMRAIEALDGFLFERLANHLLKREEYPHLNPLPERKDKGQDARTEPALTAVGGKNISVAISKEANERKVLHDCKSCRDAKHQIDVFVFCTARVVGTADREAWAKKVKQLYGWDLVIHDKNWIQSVIEKPEYESIVDRILNVPPPGGDYLSGIKASVSEETDRTLKRALPYTKLPLLGRQIDRPEVALVTNVLTQRMGALIVGKAGSGKSGIASLTCLELLGKGISTLYLDARRVAHISSRAELGKYLGLTGSVLSAVQRLGRADGCAVIVDQLDSIGALPATRVLGEWLADIVEDHGVYAIGVCRDWDLDERVELSDLRNERFVRVVSEPLTVDATSALLHQANISNPTVHLLELSRNLLNLAIVLDVVASDPKADFSSINNQLSLWDKYRKSIELREGTSPAQGRATVAAAVDLARQALQARTRIFPLGLPPSPEEERLVSRGVLIADEGQRFRFRHEQVHDYFYAWDAAERRALMPKQVLTEVGEASARSILPTMIQIYHQKMPTTAGRASGEADFLREVLGL